LKPENVQFDENFDNIKIIDFGFCRKFGQKIINPHGTPAYMSPLNKKGTTVSGYLDFYSIGIMIWLIWYGLDDVDCLYKINFIRNKLSQSSNAKPTQVELDNNCKGITPDNIKDLVGSKDYVDEFMKRESNYSIIILNKIEYNFYYINELIKWMKKKLAEILKDGDAAKSVGGKRKSLRLKNKSSKNRYSNRRNKRVRKR
jgi:serine/threonine protein kinase